MDFFTRHRWALVALGAGVLIVAFLAFRPDKLFIDNAVDESLSDVFATETSLVAEGTFSGIGHAGTGTVRVYEQDDARVLRFEDDTDIQNGPDLYIWLLASDGYEAGTPTSYIDLGKIKGNVGGQNYALPASYDPAIHKTVLVWCVRFSTPFAAAPLS